MWFIKFATFLSSCDISVHVYFINDTLSYHVLSITYSFMQSFPLLRHFVINDNFNQLLLLTISGKNRTPVFRPVLIVICIRHK